MTIPKDVAIDEEIGRGVFSRRTAARARRSRIPLNVFLERQGETNISVNRLSVAPPNKAVAIADNVAAARGADFHGWAVLTADHAARNERKVVATPLLDNPYHADISLPELAGEDREEQKRHAQELADFSEWRGRSDQ